MIETERLGRIEGPETITPTVEMLTSYNDIVLVMKDGSIEEFTNDGYLRGEGVCDSLEDYAKEVGLSVEDFDSMYWTDAPLLKCIQREIPEVVDLFLGEL